MVIGFCIAGLFAFAVLETGFLNYFLKVTKSMVGGEEVLFVEPEQKPANTEMAKSQPRVLISEVFLGDNLLPPFMELYNAADSPADLSGFSVKRRNTAGKETTFVSSQRFEHASIGPRAYFLVARASSTLAADAYWPTSYNPAKANSSLMLYGPSGQKADEVSWSSVPAGSSLTRISWSNGEFAFTDTPTPQSPASSE